MCFPRLALGGIIKHLGALLWCPQAFAREYTSSSPSIKQANLFLLLPVRIRDCL
ncbi:UNVERIFIED_CONTAM: hypothetical protein FKN15_058142 [Acipenser sinensis]